VISGARQGNRELWIAFALIVLFTLVYLGGVIGLEGIPPASELFGHGLGVLGFILMLMTETLYSLRKRSKRAYWGRLSGWLNFHIITGIVGPFLVLLHTSWKFNGLAGLTLLLTGLMVLSGFIGRYIYTSIPRSAEGFEFDEDWLDVEMGSYRQELLRWIELHPRAADEVFKRLLSGPVSQGNSGVENKVELLINSYRPGRLQNLRRAWAMRSLTPIERRPLNQLYQLLGYQQILKKQKRKLAMTRQMFSFWHTVHIPLGLVLFTAAFIHIGAAIYYATLLR
jgi:hypothetical protein